MTWYLFCRVEGSYQLDLADKNDPVGCAAAHALRNPGTHSVTYVDTGEILWSDGKDGRPDIGLKLWDNKWGRQYDA